MAVVYHDTPDARSRLDEPGVASIRGIRVRLHTSEVPDRRIAGIRAPTLIVHAKDDTLQPYRNAEVLASTIPRARLLLFEAGGHLVAFIEQAAVQKHISDNLDDVVRVGHEREGGKPIARDAERSPGASVEPVAG